MTHRPLKLAAAAALVATLLTPAAATAAQAAPADITPPSAPVIVYAQGFFCWTLYVGAQRSTDNVTPEPQLRYEAFANGRFIGVLDRGSDTTAWGDLRLTTEGPNTVFVEAVDAAGNRARSRTATVTGYDCVV
ncbi:MAG TPA: hypothetical protein VH479_07595 [Acidimicrobiales bacterium]|jgi:hypothetical protein